MNVSIDTGIVGDSIKVSSYDEKKRNTIRTLVATKEKELDEDALKKRKDLPSEKFLRKGKKQRKINILLTVILS